MKETVAALVLRRVRYNDRHSILTAWTRTHGRMSLLVSDGGTSRAGARLRALTMAPALVECQADLRRGRDVAPAAGFVMLAPLASVKSRPGKLMTAQFLCEAMNLMLTQGEPDEGVWSFVVGALDRLDREERPTALANFHLCFLYRLAAILGVEPDISTYRPGRLFDMREGVFRVTAVTTGKSLPADESAALAAISRMTFDNADRFRFTRAERNHTLDLMLEYLSWHLSIPTTLRTSTVFRAMTQ